MMRCLFGNRGSIVPVNAALALVLFLMAAPGQASALTVTGQPASEFAEIGQDLVLHLIVTPDEGASLVLDDLTFQASSPGHDGLFGSPYPLRALTASQLVAGLSLPAGSLALEWAAPLPGSAAPGSYPIEVVVSAENAAGESPGTWTTEVKVDFGEEWSADRITNFIERRGMGLFLLVVFGFGILMSLSPCIYPMIPITLAVIGTRSQEKGALHGLVMSVTYVLGMAMVYAVMGALSATVFSGINAFMQSPVVLVPIAVLLLALSFSMFGAYELEAPRFLRDRLQGGGEGNKGGVIGVFAMGMVAGLVASPCVGPFLAALLVWVATTGNWVLGFFSLFTFGIGMGLLLIGVGTFPALLSTMPRSGGWMETVRNAMGLLLVAMAFFFVRPGLVLPEKIFLPLVGAASVILAVFLGAFDPMSAASTWWDRTRKAMGLISFLLGSLILIGALWVAGSPIMMKLLPSMSGIEMAATNIGGAPIYNSAVSNPGSDTGEQATAGAAALPEKVQWTTIHTGEEVIKFLNDQRAAAKASGQPVMIDFWATWCKLCLVLDKQVWTDPAVIGEAQRFTTLKVDATKSDPEMEAVFEEYGVAGQPTIVFIDSRGEVLLSRNSNFRPADEMLKLMQSIR
jgi:thioredoxin:protein disulfide reductase